MPETQALLRPATWLHKFVECVYFFITLYFIIITLISYFGNYADITVRTGIANPFFIYRVAALLLSLLFSLRWHRKEHKGVFVSAKLHSLLCAVMRYFIAYEVAVYGFAKILKTQFAASYSRSDMPVGSLSGLELTWNYFGHSYTYAVILGVCQIGGAVLLMFRRTTLAGVFVLLPVMVNVVLINMFYHISAGAFTNSIIITVGLIYLLLLRWPDIKKLFFGEARHMQFKIIPVGLKLSVRLIILTLAFYNIYQYVAAAKPSAFTGKWNVESVSNNGRSVALGPWKNDFLVWRTVYMENSGRVGLSFNPYVYDLSNTNWGDYTYDPKKHHLLIIYPGFSAQSDTCVVTVSHYDGNKMQWNLTHNYDTLEYRLSKVLASE